MTFMYYSARHINFIFRIAVIAFFSFPFSLFSQPASETDIQQFIDVEKKSASIHQLQVVSNFIPSTYDVTRARCEWNLDPEIRYISGSVMTEFRPVGNPLQQMDFDLSHLLTVDSVLYHGTLISFQHSSADHLTVNFASVLPVQQTDSLEIFYHGEPGVSGFGSFEIDEHHGAPILWTLSEPYGSKEWWPCHQDLNDKIDTLDVIVTSPSQDKVAGNGVLIDEYIIGTNRVTHWQSTYPIAAYLVGVSVSNYSIISDTLHLSDGTLLPVVNYVYPEDSARQHARIINDRFYDVLLYFDSLFGAYPFSKEKYGQTQFGWGGGMEHQTMSFIGNFDPSLLAHELAHQWFGDKITCGTWQDIWLNEGFATYLQGLGRKRIVPSTWASFLTGLSNTITSKPDGSVFCTDTTDVGRIFDYRLTYSKGAYVLHMLRWVLGDSVFYSSIRSYISDPALIYSYAKTDDLKRHLEFVSGKDLSDFFDQWFYGSGYPSYHLEWNQQNDLVDLTIGQTQSDTSVDFFQMPVPVEFSGLNEDTIIVFDHLYSGQTFSFNLNFEIKNIFFDPERWILSAENSVISTRQKNASEYPVLLFPNPAQNQVSVYFSEQGFPVLSARIIDATGRIVKKVNFDFPSSNVDFDISALSTGFYIVEVETFDRLTNLHFVKSR